MNRVIKFKPSCSPEIELIHGDEFSFQRSGTDEDGDYVMYNDFAGVDEKDGKLVIFHNGTSYDPYHFLYCEHLDGDISIDYIKKTHNWKTMEKYE